MKSIGKHLQGISITPHKSYAYSCFQEKRSLLNIICQVLSKISWHLKRDTNVAAFAWCLLSYDAAPFTQRHTSLLLPGFGKRRTERKCGEGESGERNFSSLSLLCTSDIFPSSFPNPGSKRRRGRRRCLVSFSPISYLWQQHHRLGQHGACLQKRPSGVSSALSSLSLLDGCYVIDVDAQNRTQNKQEYFTPLLIALIFRRILKYGHDQPRGKLALSDVTLNGCVIAGY